jgi:hypothetical protein
MIKTLLGIAASPLIAIALFCFGLLSAVAHLIALPALYLWERYLERHPSMPAKRSQADPGRPKPAMAGVLRNRSSYNSC